MGADSSPGLEAHPWRRATAQVPVADADDPVLSAEAGHHLRRVLRLGPEELICATDGRGAWRICTLGRGDTLVAQGPVHQLEAPSSPLTVGFAALKGNRNELVVRKLTELGIDRIWMLDCERSVVRWDDTRAPRQLARLERIAQEALGQCRRLWMPEIRVMGFADALEQPAHDGGSAGGTVLADAGGRPLGIGDTTVLVGPEGGWSDAERDRAAGIGLGENVLRSETAAIATGAVMAQLRVGR